MPELTFSSWDMPELASKDPLAMSRAENIISNMLLRHSGDRQGFHVHTIWLHFSPENVCKWVEYASQRNVKHLTLSDRPAYSRKMEIPALFSCSCLVTLVLHRYILTSFPSGFAGFPRLISCKLCEVSLNSECLASLVLLCPLLQKLEMTRCNGLSHLIISSSTIQHLHIDFMNGVNSALVNCPKLRTLKGFMIEDLSVNGALFSELSYAISSPEMHCGSTLRELGLEFESYEAYHLPVRTFPERRFLDILGNFQSLKKLIIHLEDSSGEEANMNFPLENLFQRLPNLQMFSMLGLIVQETTIPVWFTPPHLNLKKIYIEIFEIEDKAVEIISWLLQSMPSLEALEILASDKNEEEYEGQYMKFLEDIRFLRRASLQARIIILDRVGPDHVLGSIPTPTLSMQ